MRNPTEMSLDELLATADPPAIEPGSVGTFVKWISLVFGWVTCLYVWLK